MELDRAEEGNARGSDAEDPEDFNGDVTMADDEMLETPTKRRRGRPKKNESSSIPNGVNQLTPSKKKLAAPRFNSPSSVLSTPVKHQQREKYGDNADQHEKNRGDADDSVPIGAPLVRNADRSARKKSARKLLDQTINGVSSDDEAVGAEENELAEQIWDSQDESRDNKIEASVDDSDDGREQDGQGAEGAGRLAGAPSVVPETPSKRGRGRPKGSKNKRTPTPPRHMPAYEHYFFQNRPGGIKTSNNTLSSLALLSHEDYYEAITGWTDPHAAELDFLHSLHRRSFEQWMFELEQRFNICVYGWGSKRQLLLDFAAHVAETQPASLVVVVNGFHAGITLRDILHSIASNIPSLSLTPGSSSQQQQHDPSKLSAQPADMLATIQRALAADPPAAPIVLIIHSIDAAALRRASSQALLGRLAALDAIRVVASADTPQFPLLWDATAHARFRWVFHDVTSFRGYDAEIAAGAAGGVVDEVNGLLGRSGRKMHGREGVMYVLRSLTESARSLFALLVAELLAIEDAEAGAEVYGDGNGEGDGEAGPEADDDLYGGADGNPEADMHGEAGTTGQGRQGRTGRIPGALRATIPLRALYTKAVAQLIATSELFFRELLKEFHDHQMILAAKDAFGTEVLGVPFRREEAELVLSELALGAD